MRTPEYAVPGKYQRLRPGRGCRCLSRARRGLPGAALADLWYPLEPPQAFANNGFQIPRELDPGGFNPVRLMRNFIRHRRATLEQTRPPGKKTV